MADRVTVEPGDIIQVARTHPWAGALLIVDEPLPKGVSAYLTMPRQNGDCADAFILLPYGDFEPVGAQALFRRFGG